MQTTIDFNKIRQDQRLLLDVLQEAGADLKNPKSFKCIFHEDKNPSAGIYESNGEWRYKCHVPSCGFSGDYFDVKAKLTGKTRAEIISELKQDFKPKEIKVFKTMDDLREAVTFSDSEKGGKIIKEYFYNHPETGKTDMIVFRLHRPDGSKSFRQAHPVANGFVLKKPSGPLPLYRRKFKDEIILVVEGEKCISALEYIGMSGTTSSGGAGKAEFTDWSPLEGKTVCLWPDKDQVNPDTGKATGIEHMNQVMEILLKLKNPPKIYYIDPNSLDLPVKGDVADYIQQWTKDKIPFEEQRNRINDFISHAELKNKEYTLLDEIEETKSGILYSVKWPFDCMNKFQSLLPGSVVALCASAGSAKSFFMIQCLRHWFEQGIPASVLICEDGPRHHLKRAVAQSAGNSNYTNFDWIREHPDQADEITNAYIDFIREFRRLIFAPPDELNVDSILKFVNDRIKAGDRIICIDSMTLADFGKQIWVDTKRLCRSLKSLSEINKIAIFLSVHPKKGWIGSAEKASLDDLSLGASLAQAVTDAFWIGGGDVEEKLCESSCGKFRALVNKMIYVKKVRNGLGMGSAIGFWFNPETLCFEERGLILD